MVSRRTGDDRNDESSCLETLSPAGATAADLLIREERRQAIERVVFALPEREREVFILHYFEGFKLSEAAVTLNIAVGTVKAHLAHGLEKVKAALREEGIQNG